ncbi:MAG TPA: endolytic transglycosylase MltG [candidate division Zixibacteria bacterium]|nr:endolytic transglycosylase MltG [candidate division Zixibacteria bacterium]
MNLKIFFNILAVFLIALLAVFSYFYLLPHQKANFGNEAKYLLIKKGESVNLIGANLDSLGAISSKADFVFFAKLLHKSSHLRVGRYSIKPNSSLATIIGMIERGESTPYNVTIPEGFNMGQISNLLETTIDIDLPQFRDAVTDRHYLDSLSITAGNLEGYLAPSTYNLYYDESPRRVVNKMVSHFFQSLPESFEAKARRLGLTMHQAVTLASLVEKEARLDSERPIIAAVYLNRMRKGWLLQCDPTVIYALGGLNRPLTRGDLEIDSPYNTYRNYGLPPGPITNPGVKALEASVNPAPVGLLYFVARGDGSHVFSFTLDDHNTATARVKRNNGKR